MIERIRQLYSPIQPAIRQSADSVVYREFTPHPLLQSHIYCYWTLQTTQVLAEPFHYRVIADGCIDMFVELRNPEQSFVMGFCRRYTEFLLADTFHYVGVRFLPTMFPQLFRIDASLLSDRYEALDAVVPSAAQYIADHLTDQLTMAQTGALLDRYFLTQLESARFNYDNRLYHALDLILTKQGVLNTDTDLDTGISPRQLQRLFNYYVGTTQKTFSQVVRFQQLLQTKPAGQGRGKSGLFLESGYYDQAHFIKSFRSFYGITPGRAFGG
ncbi:AraC family transcriptional regulator [Parapedobacter lycopersici]|uniref:AraC family transcriptional regulator n=1 Tax=Parapedobacter lycopersici TaxID=1864939 RepID=UPI00214D30B6|nr:helix-turn-helix domain-containing protein [Parapedobacter lycopersici]